MITYSRDELISISSELLFSCRITQEVYNLFPELSLTQSSHHHWTQSSGQTMKVKIKNRKKLGFKSHRCVNLNNLVNTNTGSADLKPHTITTVLNSHVSGTLVVQYPSLNEVVKGTSESGTLLQKIGTIISTGSRPQSHSKLSVNFKNLVNINRISSYFISCNLNFTLWNARSMGNKTSSICDSILQNSTDIFLLTESWVTDDNRDFIDADFKSSLAAFDVHHVPRNRRKGGGLAILTRKNLKIHINKTTAYRSFELMDINIHVRNEIIHVLLIYRPPYSDKHNFTVNYFLSEFSTLLESVILTPGRVVITGDFNIHIDDQTCPDATNFMDLMVETRIVTGTQRSA
ncbi:hypothetical protein SNE40_019831 [Patella caerulea]|uniref:Endonuclease/exonuclease/phosphatase domain-containing protein n=1 Tax=Patella caerulea TaxID=87958 RepID=A0AAN8GH96_PATCE